MQWLLRLLWGCGLAAGAYLTIKMVSLENPPHALQTRKANASVPKAAILPEKTFTEYMEEVRALKRNRQHERAIALLLELTRTAEQEAARNGAVVAAWYYEQLAIIFRKEERYDEEVAVLERYLRQVRRGGGTPSGQLTARLTRAQELLNSPST